MIHLHACSRAGSVSCAVEYAEGSVRLDPQDSGEISNGKTYYLLHVCLFGQWSYVCNTWFGSADLSVAALNQLGSTHGYYTGGGNYKFLNALLCAFACVR